jgi:hypothetical protein
VGGAIPGLVVLVSIRKLARQRLNHQPRSTHRGILGSSCICSRGWPCQASMGGEALGPVKAQCPSVGECVGRGVGVGGWGHTLIKQEEGE